MQEFDDAFYCESRVAKMWAGQFLEGQYSQVFHQNVNKRHVVHSIFFRIFQICAKNVVLTYINKKNINFKTDQTATLGCYKFCCGLVDF